jgi:hypothetical protein
MAADNDFQISQMGGSPKFYVNLNGCASSFINTGNFGIGTTSPATLLHVSGGSAMTAGWNKTATLQGTYPVLIFNSNANKWGGVGYDFSTAMRFWVNATSDDVSGTGTLALTISNGGNVGIGTTNPTEKLAVNGRIRAKEVVVETNWSDYVFDPTYRLAPLSEVEQRIRAEKHLPGIPSAQQIAENGVSVGDMQARLLQKVEELTLHLIQQEKQMKEQQAQIELQNQRIKHLEEENQR